MRDVVVPLRGTTVRERMTNRYLPSPGARAGMSQSLLATTDRYSNYHEALGYQTSRWIVSHALTVMSGARPRVVKSQLPRSHYWAPASLSPRSFPSEV
ncbi:hypothetical protein BDY21DRAFT_331903 [Lineolata rhizophorae]|uniref:Uncharacterized protein n=1 Tax=Lineolata rhizophorae TaxID=578093 RepID=A0A6A6PC35_9PEZI|nr:hypothetical protein BDY21DRAFT_331903 [Lineolata rhizophorae]